MFSKQQEETGGFGAAMVATFPTSVWQKSWKQIGRNKLSLSGQIHEANFEKYNIRRERWFLLRGIVATFTTVVWQWQQQDWTNPSSAAWTQTGFGKDDITAQECQSIVCAMVHTVVILQSGGFDHPIHYSFSVRHHSFFLQFSFFLRALIYHY